VATAKPNPNQKNGSKPLTLSCARCGERLRVLGVKSGSGTALRLQELGFCEATEVRKICDGGALICHLLGVRVAIGRDLGEQILVERVSPE
jgi:Fe2+ transport system protein FeoA